VLSTSRGKIAAVCRRCPAVTDVGPRTALVTNFRVSPKGCGPSPGSLLIQGGYRETATPHGRQAPRPGSLEPGPIENTNNSDDNRQLDAIRQFQFPECTDLRTGVKRSGTTGSRMTSASLLIPLYVAEFQFRYNNRHNADIFGTAIEGC
jgi:hypothetical protein